VSVLLLEHGLGSRKETLGDLYETLNDKGTRLSLLGAQGE